MRSDDDDDDDDDDKLALTKASFIIMAFGGLPFGPFLGRLDCPSRMFFFSGTGGFLGPLSSSFLTGRAELDSPPIKVWLNWPFLLFPPHLTKVTWASTSMGRGEKLAWSQ